jgi:hypothetical protein
LLQEDIGSGNKQPGDEEDDNSGKGTDDSNHFFTAKIHIILRKIIQALNPAI